MTGTSASMRNSFRPLDRKSQQLARLAPLEPLPNEEIVEDQPPHCGNDGSHQQPLIIIGNGRKEKISDTASPNDGDNDQEEPITFCWNGSDWSSLSRQLIATWIPGIKSSSSPTAVSQQAAPPNSIVTNYSNGSLVRSASSGGKPLMLETKV